MTSEQKLILVRQAFMKLQSYYAQDNYNLHIRYQIAKFSIGKDRDQKLQAIADNLDNSTLSYWKTLFKSIDIITLPKKVSPNMDKNFPFGVPQNFLHNSLQESDGILDRVIIFGVFPVELQIVAVIWVILHGVFLEKGLPSGAKGNRLLLSSDGFLSDGRSMFKPYVRQFSSWWKEGWKETQDLLDKGNDATLLNFDFKDYYHRLRLDWKFIKSECKRMKSMHSTQIDKEHSEFSPRNAQGKWTTNLWKIMEAMHSTYTSTLYQQFPSQFGDNHKEDQLEAPSSLPLGLLSSPILANVYLKPLDLFFEKEIRPVYYGRYVDDVMVVFRGPHLETFGDREIQWMTKEYPKQLSFYPSKKIQDKDKANLLVAYFLLKYLPEVFKIKEVISDNGLDIVFHMSNDILGEDGFEYENLTLQSEKTKLYQFAPGLTGIILDKFLKEQESRSSVFAFLGENADKESIGLDNIEFETSFLHPQSSEGRFRSVEESRFRMSVYLYKQIDLILHSQKALERAKIDKLTKYFSGIVLLQQYIFWEKLFTLLLVSGYLPEFVKLEARILDQINRLRESQSLLKGANINSSPAKMILKSTKEALLQHLEYSMGMAVGLLPHKIESLKKLGLKSIEYE